jgi:hypothetical protein
VSTVVEAAPGIVILGDAAVDGITASDHSQGRIVLSGSREARSAETRPSRNALLGSFMG